MADFDWPADLVPYAMSFFIDPHTGGSESPFSRQTKVYELSAPRWVCRMSFRGGYDGRGEDGEIAQQGYGPRLDGFLAKLRGRANRVRIWDFRREGSGTVANEAIAAGATEIVLTGGAGADRIIGDYVGGDGRPHIITELWEDGADLVVEVEPPFASAVAAGAATVHRVSGLFRAVSDELGANASQVGDVVTYDLEFVEDLAPAEVWTPADLAGSVDEVHYWKAEPAYLFKGDLSPVTTVGDVAERWVPVGETLASPFTLVMGGTYRIDANGNGYIEMAAGVNSAQTAGTFNLTPKTYLSAALARDTDSTSDGLTIVDGAATESIQIAFAAGTGQALIKSSRAGELPFLNSRYAAAPLQTPTVFDFYLEAGLQSSWTNNGARDPGDPSPLAAGLRKTANTWVDADSFSGAHLKINLPTKGGIRIYRIGYSRGDLSFSNRRKFNNWSMEGARLDELNEQTYDIFAIVGDSIAMGVGDQATSTAVPFLHAAQYLDIGALIPLKDPTQGMWPDQQAATGSMWPAFGKTWFDVTGTPACIVNCGNGTGVGLFAGSGFYAGGWLGSNVMPVAAAKVRHAIADVPGTLRAAITYVGTNDKGLGKTQAQLVAGYVALRDSCRLNFGIPGLPLWLISADTTTATGGTGTTEAAQYAVVRAAQAQAAADYEGIELIVPYQNWAGSGHHAAPAGNPHLDQFANNATGVLAATNGAALL